MVKQNCSDSLENIRVVFVLFREEPGSANVGNYKTAKALEYFNVPKQALF